MDSNKAVPPVIVVLLEKLLAIIRDAGATEEEFLATLQSAEAIVPLLKLQSRYRQGWFRLKPCFFGSNLVVS